MIIKHGTFGPFMGDMMKGWTPEEQVLFSWILWHVNNTDGGAFPSRERLCELCGMSVSTYKRTMHKLLTRGVIIVERRMRPNGSQTTNIIYPVITDEQKEPAKDQQEEETPKQEAPEAPKQERTTWMSAFAIAWKNKTGGLMPIARSVRPLKAVVDMYGEEKTIAAWKKYLAETEIKFLSPNAFASKAGAYMVSEHRTAYVDPSGRDGA